MKLLQEKPCALLISTMRLNADTCRNEPTTATELSSEINSTYSYTARIIDRLDDNGLLTRQKNGRKKFVKLTAAGEKVARQLKNTQTTIQEATA